MRYNGTYGPVCTSFVLPWGVGFCHCGGLPVPTVVTEAKSGQITRVAKLTCKCGRKVEMDLEHSNWVNCDKTIVAFAITITDTWNDSLDSQIFEHTGPRQTIPIRCHIFFDQNAEWIQSTLKKSAGRFFFKSDMFFSMTNDSEFVEHTFLSVNKDLLEQITVATLLDKQWYIQPRAITIRDCIKRVKISLINGNKGTSIFVYNTGRHNINRINAVVVCPDRALSKWVMKTYSRFSCCTANTGTP